MKTSLSGHAAYSTVGVFVMQSKVMLTFRKIELKRILQYNFQSKIVVLVVEKRGAAAPLAPPLNPLMHGKERLYPKGVCILSMTFIPTVKSQHIHEREQKNHP